MMYFKVSPIQGLYIEEMRTLGKFCAASDTPSAAKERKDLYHAQYASCCKLGDSLIDLGVLDEVTEFCAQDAYVSARHSIEPITQIN